MRRITADKDYSERMICQIKEQMRLRKLSRLSSSAFNEVVNVRDFDRNKTPQLC